MKEQTIRALWRQEPGVGRAAQADEAALPAAAGLPLGRCGFYCGCCPSFTSGQCAGCEDAHRAGDCFTRDCAKKRGIPFCPQCPRFPCGELMGRNRATVLDKEWLQWKRRQKE